MSTPDEPSGEVEVPLNKKWNESTLRRRCEIPALLRFLESHVDLVIPNVDYWRDKKRGAIASEVYRVLEIVKQHTQTAGTGAASSIGSDDDNPSSATPPGGT